VSSDAFSDLSKLAADLVGAGADVVPNAVKAVAVTSNKTKQAWRRKLAGSSTLPGLPGALSYTVTQGRDAVEGEVGFEKRGQGALGNVSEYGTPTVPPRGFGLASLNENEADFIVGLEKAVDDTLSGRGL
jgi:hypothetical protein